MHNKTNLRATQNLVYAAFFVALGVILPQAFHVFGDNIGKIMLPMYLPVLLGALLLPLRYTISMAAIIPVLSFFLMGMPAVPILYFIVIELIIYAITANLLIKRFNIYISVISAIIIGRSTFIISVLIAANLLGLTIPFAAPAVLFAMIGSSALGMILQLIVVPIIYNRVYKVKFVPMADQIEKLIKIINKPEHTLAAWLADDSFFTDQGLGVKPIMTKMRDDLHYFQGAIVADKVIGKAAALLLILSGAKYVHGKVISQAAIDILVAKNIPYGFGKKVKYIKNRDKTGMCPLEETVLNIDDPKAGMAAIEKKIKQLMQNK